MNFVLVLTSMLLAPAPVAAASDVSVQLNNEFVTVTRVKLSPSESTILNESSVPSLLITLHGSNCGLTEGEGTRKLAGGAIVWIEAGTRKIAASGKNSCKAFLVSVKELPRSETVDFRKAPIDGRFQTVEFENDKVRVVRFTLRPGQKWKREFARPIASPPAVSFVIAEADLSSVSRWHATTDRAAWSEGNLTGTARHGSLYGPTPSFKTVTQNLSQHPYQVVTIQFKRILAG